MEGVVGAGVGVEEDFEAVSGGFELFWDLGGGEGDDVQELVAADGGCRGRWWRVHHRSRRNLKGSRETRRDSLRTNTRK